MKNLTILKNIKREKMDTKRKLYKKEKKKIPKKTIVHQMRVKMTRQSFCLCAYKILVKEIIMKMKNIYKLKLKLILKEN